MNNELNRVEHFKNDRRTIIGQMTGGIILGVFSVAACVYFSMDLNVVLVIISQVVLLIAAYVALNGKMQTVTVGSNVVIVTNAFKILQFQFKDLEMAELNTGNDLIIEVNGERHKISQPLAQNRQLQLRLLSIIKSNKMSPN